MNSVGTGWANERVEQKQTVTGSPRVKGRLAAVEPRCESSIAHTRGRKNVGDDPNRRSSFARSAFRIVPIVCFVGLSLVGIFSMLKRSSAGGPAAPLTPSLLLPVKRLPLQPKSTHDLIVDGNAARGVVQPSKQPRDGIKDRIGIDTRFDGIVVGVVGGRNRSAELSAAHETWTTPFKNRMFITDEDVTPGTPYAAEAVNLFPGMSEAEMVKSLLVRNRTYAEASAHGEAQKHGAGWYISQAKVLLGLQRMVMHHPDALWYVIADSDTFVDAHRVASSLGLFPGGRDPEVAVALGRSSRVQLPSVADLTTTSLDLKNSSFVKETEDRIGSINMLLGGAGIVLSRGAVKAMGLGGCVEEQRTNLVWSEIPSDWRIGLCLQRQKIPRVTVWHMYQSNTELTCSYGEGTKRQGCAWHTIYRHTFSPCALTWHYQSPDQMATHYAKAVASPELCQPAGNYATTNCTCRPKSDMETWIPMLEESPELQKRLENKIARMRGSH